MDESFDYTNVVTQASDALNTAMPAIQEGVSQAVPVMRQVASAAEPLAEQAAQAVSAQTGIPKGTAKWLILGAGVYFGWEMVKGLVKPALLIGGGYLVYKKMQQKPKTLAAVGYPRWAGK